MCDDCANMRVFGVEGAHGRVARRTAAVRALPGPTGALALAGGRPASLCPEARPLVGLGWCPRTWWRFCRPLRLELELETAKRARRSGEFRVRLAGAAGVNPRAPRIRRRLGRHGSTGGALALPPAPALVRLRTGAPGSSRSLGYLSPLAFGRRGASPPLRRAPADVGPHPPRRLWRAGTRGRRRSRSGTGRIRLRW